jgi:hypothetical protein
MSSILKVDTIQDQDGNNIINENANTITIGASGDTITIPSGATFASTGIDDNATSTAITIDSSGSVGIGTSSPSAELHISKSADAGTAEFLIENSFATAGSTDEIVQIQGRFGGFDASYIITGKEADFTTSGNRSSFMSFWTRGAGTLAEAMRINSSGNVGIGTSSPEVPLSVVGLDTQIHFSESADSGGYLMSEAAGQFRISGGAAFKVGNTAWTAKSTEAAIIGHDSGGDIKFFSNTGLTVGNNFTPTERMRIDSSGKVGINTSSPGSELHVVADDVSQSWSAYDGTVLTIENNDTDGCILQTVGRNTATNEIWFGDDDSRNIGRIRYEHSDDGLEFWTNNSERMRIDSSGNVGIGTTSPTPPTAYGGLHINSQYPVLKLSSTTSGTGVADGFTVRINSTDDAQLWHYENKNMSFATNNAERMRINQNGNIQIGTTAESARLHIASSTTAGTDALVVFSDASGTDCGSIDINASANTVAYTTSSDYRLKENVDYNFDATSRIKQLKPARFNFIADADTTVDGFIAHEVSSVVPEAVTGTYNEVKTWKEHEELPEGVSVGDNKLDENGNTIPEYQGIDQSKLVPLLVKTIQELEARITALETNQP